MNKKRKNEEKTDITNFSSKEPCLMKKEKFELDFLNAFTSSNVLKDFSYLFQRKIVLK